MKSLQPLLLFFFLPLLFSVSSAQEAGKKEPALEQQIEQAVKDLGHDQFKQRKLAFESLWKIGADAVPALEGIDTRDPEVRVQVEELLGKIRSGIRPGMPEDLVKTIKSFETAREWDQPRVLKEILKNKTFGLHAVRALLLNIEDPEQALRVADQLAPDIRQLVQESIAVGDWEAAERSLAVFRSTRSGDCFRDLAAYAKSRHTLKEEISRSEKIGLEDPANAYLLAWLYRAEGNMDKAISAARRSVRGVGLYTELMREDGRWQDLADRTLKDIDSSDIEDLSFCAFYNRLAGQKDTYTAVIQNIIDFADRHPDQVWYAGEALLLNDELEHAVKVFEKHKNPTAAILAQQISRYDIVLKLADEAAKLQQGLGDARRPSPVLARLSDYADRIRGKWDPPAAVTNVPTEAELRAQLPARTQRMLEAQDLFLEKKYKAAGEIYTELAEDKPTPADALFMQGRCLTEAGDKDKGDELMKRARALPMGNGQMRLEMIQVMDQCELPREEIDEQWKIILQTEATDSVLLGRALRYYATARAQEAKDFEAADHFLERTRMSCLRRQSSFVEPEGYLQFIFRIWENKARGLLEEKDGEKKVMKTVKPVLKLLPNYGEDFMREMYEEGYTNLTSHIYTKTFQELNPLIEKYPKCGELHNKLAWQIALSKTRIPRGLELAKRAVELMPDYAPPIDTLAELHFINGNAEKAIELEKKAKKLNPDEFFDRQIERFRKGDTKTFPK